MSRLSRPFRNPITPCMQTSHPGSSKNKNYNPRAFLKWGLCRWVSGLGRRCPTINAETLLYNRSLCDPPCIADCSCVRWYVGTTSYNIFLAFIRRRGTRRTTISVPRVIPGLIAGMANSGSWWSCRWDVRKWEGRHGTAVRPIGGTFDNWAVRRMLLVPGHGWRMCANLETRYEFS